jgi:RimJ/RimL family protein N-acetyltransferase
MREALTAAISCGFTRLGLGTIYAGSDAGNTRSGALFRRLGFTPHDRSKTLFALGKNAHVAD